MNGGYNRQTDRQTDSLTLTDHPGGRVAVISSIMSYPPLLLRGVVVVIVVVLVVVGSGGV